MLNVSKYCNINRNTMSSSTTTIPTALNNLSLAELQKKQIDLQNDLQLVRDEINKILQNTIKNEKNMDNLEAFVFGTVSSENSKLSLSKDAIYNLLIFVKKMRNYNNLNSKKVNMTITSYETYKWLSNFISSIEKYLSGCPSKCVTLISQSFTNETLNELRNVNNQIYLATDKQLEKDSDKPSSTFGSDFSKSESDTEFSFDRYLSELTKARNAELYSKLGPAKSTESTKLTADSKNTPVSLFGLGSSFGKFGCAKATKPIKLTDDKKSTHSAFSGFGYAKATEPTKLNNDTKSTTTSTFSFGKLTDLINDKKRKAEIETVTVDSTESSNIKKSKLDNVVAAVKN
jgi:hypothetical protein